MKFKLLQLLIILSLTLSLSASLALAAGGGGGGGGGGSAARYTDLKCNDAGALSFTRGTKWDPVKVMKKDDGTLLTIPGTWSGGKFTSDEGLLREAGTYVVQDPLYGDKTVKCPGFKFSCSLVSLNLQECVNDNGITARFDLENADADVLKLEFVLSDSSTILKYEKNSQSSFLKNLVLENAGSAFTVTAEGVAKVKTFQVSIPQCVGQYYVYSKINCVDKEVDAADAGKKDQQAAEENGKALKCGGYLDIKDRVKCRIDLRGEQKDEYENFFPEECRSWENQGSCVALYRAVQNCWDQGSSVSRIACLRGKVGISSVASQRRECKGDQQCLDKLKDDVYTLIKLRLYNLEEEAEELQEKGEISEDDLVDFVVKMEESKLAFNTAQSKKERQDVILQARKYWLELMRKRI